MDSPSFLELPQDGLPLDDFAIELFPVLAESHTLNLSDAKVHDEVLDLVLGSKVHWDTR